MASEKILTIKVEPFKSKEYVLGEDRVMDVTVTGFEVHYIHDSKFLKGVKPDKDRLKITDGRWLFIQPLYDLHAK